MKKVKNSIIALIASAILIGSSLTIKASLNNVDLKLSRIADSNNNVLLQIEDVNSMVKSFQLSLKLVDVTLNSIDWSSKIDNKAKATYINNNNTVDIYVTSTEDLVDENGNLVIGLLNISGDIGTSYNVLPNEQKDSIKLVTNSNKKLVSNNVETIGDTSFVINEVKVPDTNKPDTDKPDTDKPDTNKPDTDKPDTNKPDTNKPDTDKPDTDKPDTDKPDMDKPDTDISDNDIEEEGSKILDSLNTNIPLQDIKENKENTRTGDNVFSNLTLIISLLVFSASTFIYIIFRKLRYKAKH